MTSWQADVIADLTATEDEPDGTTFTVTRRAAGTYDGHGVAVPGASSTFPIVASVQAAGDTGRGRSIVPLPEGRRIEDVREVSTATPLIDADEIAIETDAGLVETFVVYSVQTFALEGDKVYLAMAAKSGVP